MFFKKRYYFEILFYVCDIYFQVTLNDYSLISCVAGGL